MKDSKIFIKIKKLFFLYFSEEILKNIESVYLYGSSAAGDFKEDNSDIDMFIVIRDTLQNRFQTEELILKKFELLIHSFFSNNQNLAQQNHNATILTEMEFRAHCLQYPARVLYPLKKSIWKLLYGKNIHSDLKLPNKKEFNLVKAQDFDLFANLWYENIMNHNYEKATKYLLRATRKYLWIKCNKYISNKWMILNEFPSSNEINIPLEEIRKALDNINNNNVLDRIYAADTINTLLQKMGAEIYNFLKLKKSFSSSDFFNLSPWRDFSWELRQIFNQYHNIKKKKDILEARKFLIDTYYDIKNYFYWAFSVEKEAVHFGVGNIKLIRRSYLYKYNLTNFKIILYFISDKHFQYFFIQHQNKINIAFFSKLNFMEIEKYIEDIYLPSLEGIFKKFFS